MAGRKEKEEEEERISFFRLPFLVSLACMKAHAGIEKLERTYVQFAKNSLFENHGDIFMACHFLGFCAMCMENIERRSHTFQGARLGRQFSQARFALSLAKKKQKRNLDRDFFRREQETYVPGDISLPFSPYTVWLLKVRTFARKVEENKKAPISLFFRVRVHLRFPNYFRFFFFLFFCSSRPFPPLSLPRARIISNISFPLRKEAGGVAR